MKVFMNKNKICKNNDAKDSQKTKKESKQTEAEMFKIV